jgi:hypothetical protein
MALVTSAKPYLWADGAKPFCCATNHIKVHANMSVLRAGKPMLGCDVVRMVGSQELCQA